MATVEGCLYRCTQHDRTVGGLTTLIFIAMYMQTRCRGILLQIAQCFALMARNAHAKIAVMCFYNASASGVCCNSKNQDKQSNE